MVIPPIPPLTSLPISQEQNLPPSLSLLYTLFKRWLVSLLSDNISLSYCHCHSFSLCFFIWITKILSNWFPKLPTSMFSQSVLFISTNLKILKCYFCCIIPYLFKAFSRTQNPLPECSIILTRKSRSSLAVVGTIAWLSWSPSTEKGLRVNPLGTSVHSDRSLCYKGDRGSN